MHYNHFGLEPGDEETLEIMRNSPLLRCFGWLALMMFGLILGSVIESIRLDYRSGYPPHGDEIKMYLIGGLPSLFVLVIVLFKWIKDNIHEKRPILTFSQRILVLLIAASFFGGTHAARIVGAENVAYQKETDLTNCQHILGKHMTPQVQESCRIHSRDCRNSINCDRLPPQVQIANMKRWPKQYKRPYSSCQTAQLLCLIPKIKK